MQPITNKDLAKLIKEYIQSDRWVFIVYDGVQGGGKSVSALKLISEYDYKGFDYDRNITYSRAELMTLIDGKGSTKKGRLPEYSVILGDELISIFNKRNWYDKDQQEVVELFNKIRDRHLLIIGCVPNFWDLDSSIRDLATLRIFVHNRGDGVKPTEAFIFAPDDNPFSPDKWHRKYNEKVWAKKGSPFGCKGFVAPLFSTNLKTEEFEKYMHVRNTKRNSQLEQDRKKKRAKRKKEMMLYNIIKYMREKEAVPFRKIGEMANVNEKSIRLIHNEDVEELMDDGEPV
jgi:hypothetical protein